MVQYKRSRKNNPYESEKRRFCAIVGRGCRLGSPNMSASSMVLLPRLTKQIMRRCSPQLLGLDLRLLMALSYVGDHTARPSRSWPTRCAWTVRSAAAQRVGGRRIPGPTPRRRRSPSPPRLHQQAMGRQALERVSRALEEIEDEVLQALDADERVTLRKLVTRAVRDAEPTAEDSCVQPLCPPRRSTWASRPVAPLLDRAFRSGGRTRQVGVDELHDHGALADGGGAALDRPDRTSPTA